MQVFWTPKLLNRSEIDGVVIKTYYANGSMLRRSAQLLLTPEDHHFEGSMHLRRRSNVERRDRVMVSTMGGRGDFRNTICGGNSEFLELEKFKIRFSQIGSGTLPECFRHVALANILHEGHSRVSRGAGEGVIGVLQ